jgi:hypothetical protein
MGSGRFRGAVRKGIPESESNDQRIGSAAAFKIVVACRIPRNLPLSTNVDLFLKYHCHVIPTEPASPPDPWRGTACRTIRYRMFSQR